MPIVRTFSGDKIFVKPAEWTVEEDGKILAKVEQLPLRLAWAITVHKKSRDELGFGGSGSFQGVRARARICGAVAVARFAGLSLRGLNDMVL